MSSESSGTLTAYVDEAGGRLADGQWTYALGAVLLSSDQHGASVAELSVGRVVLESRGGNDKHDVRTRDRLRRSRSLSTGLPVDHESKIAEPMTWVADFVISSYLAAHQQGEQKPWQIVSGAHVIDIVTK